MLLLLAQEDHGTLVSHDQRLLRVAAAQGLAVRDPITSALAARVAEWEGANLPRRGIARVLAVVERWLRNEDPHLAERFRDATADLTTLPL